MKGKKALETEPFIFENLIVWLRVCFELFARYPKTILPFLHFGMSSVRGKGRSCLSLYCFETPSLADYLFRNLLVNQKAPLLLKPHEPCIPNPPMASTDDTLELWLILITSHSLIASHSVVSEAATSLDFTTVLR